MKWFKKWQHKLFECPTFWQIKPFFHCPSCGKGYRCYWEGNDIAGVGIDYCDDCAKELETTIEDATHYSHNEAITTVKKVDGITVEGE